MKTTLKVQLCMAALACAAGGAMFVASGCELVTDFDRSLIDAGPLDDGGADDVYVPPFDANFDAPTATDSAVTTDGEAGDDADTTLDAGLLDTGLLDGSSPDAADANTAGDASDSSSDAANDADAAG